MYKGISTVCCYMSKINECIRLVKENDFGAIDFFIVPPKITLENIVEFINEAKKAGMSIFTLKAPSFIENLCSIIPQIHDLTYHEYLKTLMIAKETGGKAVIVKPGMMFFVEKKCRDLIQKRFLDSLYSLTEYAEKNKILLLLENYYYPYEVLRNVRDFVWFAETLMTQYENIGFALNIPHFLEARNKITELIHPRNRIVLEKIKLIYVGLRSSPWEYSMNVSSSSTIISGVKEILKETDPEFLVLATPSEPILRLLIDQLEGSL